GASLRVGARERLTGEELRLRQVRRRRVAGEASPAVQRQRQPGDLLERKREERVDVEAAVRALRQVDAAVDVERRERGLECEVERRVPDRRGAVEELDRREPLLDDGRGEERLGPLEADVQRVRPDVLRQEAARDDLPGRRERQVALEVLEELLVGVLMDR